MIRLKKINPMSQSCLAHLFFGARLIQQNSRFDLFFFCLLNFFFSFLWTCSSKYTRKDMTDTVKHFVQQTSSTLCSVFKCLVSCSSKNQVPYFKAVTDSNLTRLLLRREKKTLKKNAFRSGLPICHELWDIAFIFFSLINTFLKNDICTSSEKIKNYIKILRC